MVGVEQIEEEMDKIALLEKLIKKMDKIDNSSS